MREEPGARRAGLSREQIGEKAVEIADAEGFDDVSMRRIARELGAGTMTLYHYVRNKDELLGLMHDAVMGELIVPDEEFASGWREALTQIAQRTRDAFMRHPWAWEGRGAGTSPNTMRHIEQSLAAVEDLDVDPEQRLEVVALVDDFVFGSVLRAGTRFSDPPSEEELGAILAYVEDQLATGDFPHTRELLGDEDPATFFGRVARRETADARFERGLELLLDGVELQISQK
jgi:AcrR family transcriptional regulator